MITHVLPDQKPAGILPLLDTFCKTPKATDLTFTQQLATLKVRGRNALCNLTCQQDHGSNAFVPAKSDRDLAFTINHFAGEVAPHYLSARLTLVTGDLLQ